MVGSVKRTQSTGVGGRGSGARGQGSDIDDFLLAFCDKPNNNITNLAQEISNRGSTLLTS